MSLPNVITEVVHLARTHYRGASHTHLGEPLGEREDIEIGRATLRRILLSSGIPSPRRRRPPMHRTLRQRMPREGMLAQLDGSHHRWLGPSRGTAGDGIWRGHAQFRTQTWMSRLGTRRLLPPRGRRGRCVRRVPNCHSLLSTLAAMMSACPPESRVPIARVF